MKISIFSYIRNSFKYEYPFLQSIQSVLPICDEFVIAVGDSDDGTKEAINNIGNSKIKIIDTIWDERLRTNGKIFAQQANIALKQITGDWAFHIQADEVIHEKDLNKIIVLEINGKVSGIYSYDPTKQTFSEATSNPIIRDFVAGIAKKEIELEKDDKEFAKLMKKYGPAKLAKMYEEKMEELIKSKKSR